MQPLSLLASVAQNINMFGSVSPQDISLILQLTIFNYMHD